MGHKYPVGLYAEPTGELEHAAGIHSFQLSPELAKSIQTAFPAFWVEWNLSSKSWWHSVERLSDVLSAVEDIPGGG